ncbi:cytosine permease [Hoeflea sp. Naph1]|uniref:cytosine permease n=1 Tax=Hoeflea sp. Naph1 TaxID=3388653 RepID=UPI00398FA269
MTNSNNSTKATWDTVSVSEEWHDKPIPMRGRLGFKEPAIVWAGFGVAFICAVIGGIIQQGLGTINAIWAIIVGNLILFVYAAAIGYPAGKWGLNFPLTIKAVFGGKGSYIPIAILALLVTGWFAFHSWLTGDIIKVAFGIENKFAVGLIAAGAALLYGIPVIYGIKSMSLVRKIAIPAMVLFAAYYIVTKVIPAGAQIWTQEGTGAIGFWTGVSMAWATYAVSGTMTGDIVRYTRNGEQAIWVTAVAFVFSNAPFMILGAIISAAVGDSTVQYFLDSPSLSVLIPIAMLGLLSTWSTADACLYNAALGFTNAFTALNWRKAAYLGLVLGAIAAGTGIVGSVVDFLLLIGLVVPPIGAVIIADYFVVRRGVGFSTFREDHVNIAAIVATLAGLGAGYLISQAYPNFIFGIPGIVVGASAYLVLWKVAGNKLGANLSTKTSTAESEDQQTSVAVAP